MHKGRGKGKGEGGRGAGKSADDGGPPFPFLPSPPRSPVPQCMLYFGLVCVWEAGKRGGGVRSLPDTR